MSTMNESVYNQQSQYAPFDSGLAVSSFLPTDDPIASLNNAMAFICTTFSPSYLQINNQFGTSSYPSNQVAMQGRQTQSYRGNYKAGNATRTWVMRYMGNSTANQSKEKMLLAHVPEAGFALNDEQLAFLADSGEKVDLGIDDYTLTNNA
ncbi:hypothetical protein Tco_1095427 [Tanacetum coccineum]